VREGERKTEKWNEGQKTCKQKHYRGGQGEDPNRVWENEQKMLREGGEFNNGHSEPKRSECQLTDD